PATLNQVAASTAKTASGAPAGAKDPLSTIASSISGVAKAGSDVGAKARALAAFTTKALPAEGQLSAYAAQHCVAR
ncbi:MAG: hypothetical protein ACRD0H_29430, partial [Actinomycetes bacterium]